MKIAIMGSGGVGGYYGARLAHAGHDVRFVARGEHAAAMSEHGLTVHSGLGDVQIRPVQVSVDPAEIGPADLAIVAVKLWDTEQAARGVLPMIAPHTSVFSLQNGVDKDDILSAVIGREHVLGGVTYIISTISEPGVISHSGTLQRVVLGELDGRDSARLRAVVEAFASAGVDVHASGDIRRETWEKFAFLAASSAVTAATRETLGAVRFHPSTRALLRDAMAEVVAVAAAEGIAFPEGWIEERLAFVDGLPAGGRASMANDLLRGGRLELEWLSGAVVRRGERAGVPTPVHRTLYAVLVLHADGH